MADADTREVEGTPHRGAAVYSGAGLLVLLVAGVAVGTLLAGTAAAEQRVAGGLQQAVSGVPGLLGVAREATGLGSPVAAAVVLGLLGAALLLHGRRRLAGYVALTGIGAVVLGAGTAAVAAALGTRAPGEHTLSAAVAYGLLLVVLTPAVPPRWRRSAAAVAVALVVLVGLTRLALADPPAPVLLGGALGAGWLAVTTAAFGHRGRLAAAGPYRPVEAGRVRPARPAWPRAGALAALWLLLLGALLGAGTLVTVAAVQRFDAAVTGWFVAIRTPLLTSVAGVFGALGDTPTVVAGALTIAVLMTVATRSARPVFLVVLVLGGELALFLVTAAVVGRPRPDVGHLGLLVPPTSSFPSGHVSATVCLYGLAALLAARRIATGRRWPLVLVPVVAVACVGSARLYFGMHHPTDVLASLLFAVPWLLACLRLGPVPRDDG
ncbi:phosphatase PAP2 family protein [Pseudonocardia oceani]|uniref:Phosphatase PAP2 family protein n=1 Tax=Pseudonocardia oceani TaxID=2792013 RepID=A0ABS6UBM5_9PSEU|nr:phosphatase PAP2 family protein [Pseudonocardia oceani]MBW0091328.1 phosphatase PAP2 family protein [Pseudonocardia oceani]MBW0110553.1 phosphatase PAP2 family protein [Pseudonocardia oceani]MBW0129574.1 phosphatase PAP2 family protein [Pseudonocardia oceani]